MQDDRPGDRARWQRYHAAEHSSELLVRKTLSRTAAQLSQRRMGKPFGGCANPAHRGHHAGQPGPHLAAEELPQGGAPSLPPRGAGDSLGPPDRVPGVAEAPAALPGGMRCAAATKVSLADSRMCDLADRAEACRSACVTRVRGEPTWKSAAASSRRMLRDPRLEASIT